MPLYSNMNTFVWSTHLIVKDISLFSFTIYLPLFILDKEITQKGEFSGKQKLTNHCLIFSRFFIAYIDSNQSLPGTFATNFKEGLR